MLKTKKILHIFAALALLIFLWITFVLVQGLFQRTNSHHELYIPAHAESVLKLDGEEIIYTFTSELLLADRTDGGLGDIMNTSDDSEALGIEFRSAVYIFSFEEDGKKLLGILMHVLDEAQFDAGMHSRKTEASGYSVKNGVGLVLVDLSEKVGETSKLNALAGKMLQKETGFDQEKLATKKENSKLTYWKKKYTSADGSIILDNIQLAFFMDGSTLDLIGLASSKSSLNTDYPVLKKDGLSIRMAIVPDALNDFWKEYTTEMGLPLPAFSSISGNYHYMEPSGIDLPKFLPHFDGIYSFQDTLPIQVPLYVLNAKELISEVTSTSFKLGPKTLYYKQIDPKTIYLGQTKFVGHGMEKSTLFELSGSLKHVLEIRNGGMMTRLLSMSSEYRATKILLTNIQTSDFSMKKAGENAVSMSGKLEFKQGKSALRELMRFLVDSGLIN